MQATVVLLYTEEGILNLFLHGALPEALSAAVAAVLNGGCHRSPNIAHAQLCI